MTKPTDSGPAEATLQHLRTAAPGSVLVLEDGDAAMAPSGEGAAWDWDAEAIAPGEHCQYCGTGERLFRIDEGHFACGACLHGTTSQREASLVSLTEQTALPAAPDAVPYEHTSYPDDPQRGIPVREAKLETGYVFVAVVVCIGLMVSGRYLWSLVWLLASLFMFGVWRIGRGTFR